MAFHSVTSTPFLHFPLPCLSLHLVNSREETSLASASQSILQEKELAVLRANCCVPGAKHTQLRICITRRDDYLVWPREKRKFPLKQKNNNNSQPGKPLWPRISSHYQQSLLGKRPQRSSYWFHFSFVHNFILCFCPHSFDMINEDLHKAAGQEGRRYPAT